MRERFLDRLDEDDLHALARAWRKALTIARALDEALATLGQNA